MAYHRPQRNGDEIHLSLILLSMLSLSMFLFKDPHLFTAIYPCFYLKGKFQEAELEFIKAGKPKEAVQM